MRNFGATTSAERSLIRALCLAPIDSRYPCPLQILFSRTVPVFSRRTGQKSWPRLIWPDSCHFRNILFSRFKELSLLASTFLESATLARQLAECHFVELSLSQDLNI